MEFTNKVSNMMVHSGDHVEEREIIKAGVSVENKEVGESSLALVPVGKVLKGVEGEIVVEEESDHTRRTGGDFECFNTFAILSEGENEVTLNAQKDYGSDPGSILGDHPSKKVSVRKSRWVKVELQKLNL